MTDERQIPVNEHGDMLVHEDDIESVGLLDVARLQKIESLGYSLDEDGIETYEDMQRVSKAFEKNPPRSQSQSRCISRNSVLTFHRRNLEWLVLGFTP